MSLHDRMCSDDFGIGVGGCRRVDVRRASLYHGCAWTGVYTQIHVRARTRLAACRRNLEMTWTHAARRRRFTLYPFLSIFAFWLRAGQTVLSLALRFLQCLAKNGAIFIQFEAALAVLSAIHIFSSHLHVFLHRSGQFRPISVGFASDWSRLSQIIAVSSFFWAGLRVFGTTLPILDRFWSVCS